MFTLAIDTSSVTISVALLKEERVLQEITVADQGQYSASLLPIIEELLRRSSLTIGEIGLFACSIGPGNFTGLRVGVSTVKGLALAARRPVIGVSTLAALALNIAPSESPICPLLDGKRSRVFSALYRHSPEGELKLLAEERLESVVELLERLDSRTVFVGQGALAYRRMIIEHLGENAYFAPAHQHYIRASAVALLGIRKYEAGFFEKPAGLSVNYLRAFGSGS